MDQGRERIGGQATKHEERSDASLEPCAPRAVRSETRSNVRIAGNSRRQHSSSAVVPSRETPITGPDRLSSVVSQGVPPRGDVPVGRDRLPNLRTTGGASGGGSRQRQNKSEGDQDSGADGRCRRSKLSGPRGRAHGNLPFRNLPVQPRAVRFGSGRFRKIG